MSRLICRWDEAGWCDPNTAEWDHYTKTDDRAELGLDWSTGLEHWTGILDGESWMLLSSRLRRVFVIVAGV